MKAILFIILFCKSAYSAEPNFENKIERGKYYFNASGCMNCHTPDRKLPLGGGKKIETPFGTFYTPNITPDKKYGIGNWTDRDFLRALRKGISPGGDFYYPSFPFTTYSKLTDEDILSMKAYMNTFAAIPFANKLHLLKFPLNQRKTIGFWRALHFRSHINTKNEEEVFKYQGSFRSHRDKSREWNRGAYLVESALHCTECHTPRDFSGGLKVSKWMSGEKFSEENKVASNITSDLDTGLGRWSREDWRVFLQEGTTPDGDDVGGEMYQVIKNGTSKLTESDLDDVVTYLQSLRPISRLTH